MRGERAASRGRKPITLGECADVLTSSAPIPPIWKLPALALGKDSTAGAELWWARRTRANGDEFIELEGRVRP